MVGQPFDSPDPGFCSKNNCTYTNRYDLGASKWDTYAISQVTSADIAFARMPRLASDGRGHSLIVWAKAAAGAFTLEYQRHRDGQWSAITAIPGGTLTSKTFILDSFPALSMNASGMDAVSWVNRSSSGATTGIRLASFY